MTSTGVAKELMTGWLDPKKNISSAPIWNIVFVAQSERQRGVQSGRRIEWWCTYRICPLLSASAREEDVSWRESDSWGVPSWSLFQLPSPQQRALSPVSEYTSPHSWTLHQMLEPVGFKGLCSLRKSSHYDFLSIFRLVHWQNLLFTSWILSSQHSLLHDLVHKSPLPPTLLW